VEANDNDAALVALTNEQHHAHPAVGASGLKELARSPAHYWSKYRDKNRQPSKPSAAMAFGTAYHAMLFEPGKFFDRYAEMPEGLDRRTKEGKALCADIEASGKQPITSSDLNALETMVDRVNAHPVARHLLRTEGAGTEQSMFWIDRETRLGCKIRPDWYVEPGSAYPNGAIIDLKTTSDARPEAFGRSVWNYGYWLQAAWYIDGFRNVFETSGDPVYLWLAQEGDAPYAAAMYAPAPDLIDYGRREYRRLLDVLARCETSGEWPAYPTEISRLEMPAWVDRQIQDAA